MAQQRGMRCARSAFRQRGQAMLLTAALIALGVLAVVLSTAGSTSTLIANQRAQINSRVLAAAKEALIGYAVSQTNQPGVLPCPDMDNDGSADSPCGAAGVTALGRLPWKTLGLPDLRDGAGECLWYAVSSNFKNSGASGPAVVNSDSLGTLVVNDGAGTPLPSPSSPAAAIVFAPGGALAGQDRTGPATTCGGNNAAANYLEGSNAVAGTTYVSSNATNTLNDRLLLVSNADVMTPVEQRASAEILQILGDYRSGSACSCYPWADNNWNGIANPGERAGGVPLVSASPNSWLSSAGYNPPAWLTNNQWYKVIFYQVSVRDCESGISGDPRMNVGSTSNVRVLLITTGPIVTGDGRPSINWSNYVDDPGNKDGGDNFIIPLSTAYARDRIYFRTSP